MWWFTSAGYTYTYTRLTLVLLGYIMYTLNRATHVVFLPGTCTYTYSYTETYDIVPDSECLFLTASGLNLLMGANFASGGSGYYDPTARIAVRNQILLTLIIKL
jgi:hypothetical protein